MWPWWTFVLLQLFERICCPRYFIIFIRIQLWKYHWGVNSHVSRDALFFTCMIHTAGLSDQNHNFAPHGTGENPLEQKSASWPRVHRTLCRTKAMIPEPGPRMRDSIHSHSPTAVGLFPGLLQLADVWGIGGTAPPFLTSTLDDREWSASRPCRFTKGGKNPRYPPDRRLGGPQCRSDLPFPCFILLKLLEPYYYVSRHKLNFSWKRWREETSW
jgi:hypothetical protein